ncbi:MAG: NifU family protein [Clostridiales bacterium]|nr:NifU family protein [Clostridiales bacterium]
MENEIRDAIEKVRPFLQRDGGDVEFMGYEDGIVKVRLQGACSGCPGAQMTLKMVIERMLREQFPEVKGVEGV